MKVAVSGHFDPLHIGHVIHFQKAKALGDSLIVIVNSDSDVMAKHGCVLMPQEERARIIKEFACVDEVYLAKGSTAEALGNIKPNIFAKGGDRTLNNIPHDEKQTCESIGCQIVTGIGEPPPFHSSRAIFMKLVRYAIRDRDYV